MADETPPPVQVTVATKTLYEETTLAVVKAGLAFMLMAVACIVLWSTYQKSQERHTATVEKIVETQKDAVIGITTQHTAQLKEQRDDLRNDFNVRMAHQEELLGGKISRTDEKAEEAAATAKALANKVQGLMPE